MNWMILPLKRYAQFSGRSRPMEFWMFFVLQLIVYTLLTVVAVVVGVGIGGLSAMGSNTEGAAAGAGILGMMATMGVFFLAYILAGLVFLVPNLAVSARRLHDTEKSGWWQLIYWVPALLGNVLPIVGASSNSTALASVGMILSLIALVGLIVLIVFYCLPGTVGPNRYGPDPKEGERAAMSVPPYQPQSY